MISPPTTPVNSRFHVKSWRRASAALGPEEHGAGEVVPLEQLRGRPSKRTSPFSRKIARSAIASATFSDCSTMSIVWPRALRCSTSSSSRWTTTGASPSESSSISRISGSWRSTRPSASICCCPPERLRASLLAPVGELGEQLEDVRRCAASTSRCDRGVEPGADREVLLDGEAREHALAAGQLHDRRAAGRASRARRT